MKRLMVCAFALGVTLSGGIALAAPGDPDPGFGSAGIVTGGLLDTDGALAVDSSGRIVVAGTTGGQAAFARYTSTGAPDTGFSGDGRVELGLTGTDFQFFDARTLADGSTLVAGVYRTLPTMPFNHVFFTAKVSSTGDLVGGYGTGGVATAFGGFTFLHPDAAIAPDGSITIAIPGDRIPAMRSSNSVPLVSNPRPLGPVHRHSAGPPTDASPSDGYALRGVVRPAATQEIHVGLASSPAQGPDENRVVLTSQTVGTDDHQLVGDAAAQPRPPSATTRSRSTSSAPTSCSTRSPESPPMCTAIRQRDAGHRLGRGWCCHACGPDSATSVGSRLLPVAASASSTTSSFVSPSADVARRPPVVQRSRRLDVPEGLDADGRRPDRERHRRCARRWRARHDPDRYSGRVAPLRGWFGIGARAVDAGAVDGYS